MSRAAALLAAVLLSALVLAAPAPAQDAPAGDKPVAGSTEPAPDELRFPAADDERPAGFLRLPREVRRLALRDPRVREVREERPRPRPVVYTKGTAQWQVSLFRGREERAQVLVDDATGRVLEAWTGHQVRWTMARGYPGAFGRRVNAWYVWIPLCVLFVLPFVDPRRPFRLLHLDLLVLAGGLSASLAFFNAGRIDVSVPLVYPFLLYLLGRAGWLALRGRERPPPLRLLVPVAWLTVALVFLVGFRIGLNVTSSNVIDVGYAGVIGADHLVDGRELWGNFPEDNEHGDTYGPVNYLVYVPFEQALSWSGRWDDLPAAHAAAIVFDLLTLAGLWLLGRRLGGPALGVVLAFAWAANPWSVYALNTNANDTLVAMFLVGALLAATHPVRRGAAVALAGGAKFAPLALAPAFARTPRSLRPPPADPLGPAPGAAKRPRTRLLRYAAGVAGTLAVVALPVLLGSDPDLFLDRTLGFQRTRESPFSVWGAYGWETPQAVVQGLAVLAALAAGLLRARRDVPQLAALGAAVLLLLQLGVQHWFYLYVVWVLPFLLVAWLGGREVVDPAPPRLPRPRLRRRRGRAVAT